MHDQSSSPAIPQPQTTEKGIGAKSVREEIIRITQDVIRDAADGQTPEQTLELIDSIDALEILVSIEQHFGIRIEDDDLNAELLTNLDRIAEYVERKLPLG